MKKYKIGYVPGVFDLFHVGHLNLIKRSKELSEYLIVGVLTDELVKYYKGMVPFIPYEERKAIIEALIYVDEVIPVTFENTDKIKAWKQLKYNCHFSGDDHIKDWNKIRKELELLGADMVFFSYTKSTSSTQIKELITKMLL